MNQWRNHQLQAKLNLTIYTCSRPVNFLKQMAAELCGQGVIPNIQHGSKEEDNFAGIPSSHLGEVERLKEAQEPNFPAEKIIHRANRNLAQAFLMPDNESGGSTAAKDILILEDDVQPCKDLSEQIQVIYSLIEKHGLQKYVIALYSNYQWGTGPQALVTYPPEIFYGTQAMLYSANVRTLCHDFHYNLCDELPADFVTKRIVTDNNDIKLFASRFSLFQHIGTTTSGLGNFHRTSNFLDEVQVS